jgi:hypothetical protein
MGLQRTPAPPPSTMGYLVAQGLAIVLLGDYAIAMIRNEPSTLRTVCQAAGFWRDAPEFEDVHGGMRDVKR